MIKNILLLSLFFLNITIVRTQSKAEWRLNISECLKTAYKKNNQQGLDDLQHCLNNSLTYLNVNDSLTALIYHKIGSLNYKLFVRGNPTLSAAKENWHKALAIRKKIYAHNPNHIDIATSYRLLGRTDEAPTTRINYFLQSIHIFEALNIKKNLIRNNYRRIGDIYAELGDTENMMHYYNLNLKLIKEAPNYDSYEFAKGLLTIAEGINLQKTHGNKAIELLHQAIEIFQSKAKEYQSKIANCYLEIHTAYRNKGNHEKALFWGIKALRLYQKLDDISAILVVRNNLSISYNRMKNYKAAREQLLVCLDLNKKINDMESLSANYDNLADTYLYQNQLDTALHYYQKAIITSIPNFNNTNSNSNPNLNQKDIVMLSKPDLLTYLADKAQAQVRNNQPKFALETYKTSDQLLTLLKHNLQTQQSQLFWREKAFPIYEKAISTTYELYQQSQDKAYLQELFKWSEKAKASILLDATKEISAQFLTIPDHLINQGKNLKIKQGYFEKQVIETSESSNSLDSLIHYRTAYQEFIDTLETKYPAYYELKYQTKTANLEEIQSKLLDHKTAMIEYFTGDKFIYTFSITQQDFEVHKISKKADFDQQLIALQKSLRSNEDFENYTYFAHEIYKNYVQIAVEPLKNKGIKKLIIIPDDRFSTIPYEALLTKVTPAGPAVYKKLPYLIHDFQFTYAYSSTLLIAQEEPIIAESQGVLGFEPPFEDLFSIGIKTEKIKEITNGLFYIKEEATKKRLLDWKENVDILHLMSHAEMDDLEPSNSKILLADTPLKTVEIYNFPFKAKLAILDACETGIGKNYKGEGVMSLARAFMYSGCPSVVTSLWKVDATQTSELIEHFYTFLKKGFEQDEALHQAKLQYLTQQIDEGHYNPFYWAAFVHIGNTESIPLPEPGMGWLMILLIWGAIIGLVISLLYGWKFKN